MSAPAILILETVYFLYERFSCSYTLQMHENIAFLGQDEAILIFPIYSKSKFE